jgi:regulatory protein
VKGTAKDRALGLLAVRWRSRQELSRRLTRAGFDADEVEVALGDLESVGLIDDDRFAREVVKDRATRRLAGDRAIRSALREKGVPEETAAAALEKAGDEAARAESLAAQRAPRMSGLAPEAASRRLYGLLLRRGFPPPVARDATRRALSALVATHELDEPGL